MWSFVVHFTGGEVSVKRRNAGEDYHEFGSDDRKKQSKWNKRKGKSALRKGDEAADDWGTLSGDCIAGKLPRRVNKITLKVA